MIGQREELTAVKRKIHALMQKTIENGATEAEAILAMNKAGELLLQFNLTMSDVELRDERCVTKTLSEPWGNRDAVWHCFNGLSKFCGVKMWISHTGYKQKSWAFFGLESDVDMAIYLCRLIMRAEETELKAFKRTPVYTEFAGHRRIATRNFVEGFGNSINTRFLRMTAENQEAERKAHEYMRAQTVALGAADDRAYTQTPQGTALICLAKQEKVEREFAERGPKLRTLRATMRGQCYSGARQLGAEAGSRVNLNRPLGGANGGGNGLLQ